MNSADTKQIEFLLNDMRRLQADHPKARVVYDFDRREVLITYPLPEDFFTIKSIKFRPASPKR